MKVVLVSFVAWRLTSLLGYERGPFDVFTRIRDMLGIGHDDNGLPVIYPDNLIGELFGCFYCLSVWGAILPSVLVSGSLYEFFLLWMAGSTGAIVIHELIGGLTWRDP